MFSEEALSLIPTLLARLGLAFLLSLPLAWERGRSKRTHLGIRTIPLVSIGACGYMLLAEYLVREPNAHSRIIQGILGGIGFIGGGAIFKQSTSTSGIATAATIWNVGAIGVAIGAGNYWLGLLLCIASILVLGFGRLLLAMMDGRARH